MNRLHTSWAGATLAERIAFVRHCASPDPGPHDADAGALESDTLAVWARASAGGDRSAFARRLAWDDVSADVAERALAEDPPADFPIASWVAPLADLEVQARECAQDAGGQGWHEKVGALGGDVPFVDVWVPALQLAHRWLDARAPAVRDVLSPAAIRSLDDLLLRELSRLGELALLEDCRAHTDADAADAGEEYWRYVRALLASRYLDLLESLPVLARHVVLVTEQWAEQTACLVERVIADRAAIEAMFGAPATVVVAITAGLSDRHDGGGRVARVAFASGLTLAYKPRDLGLERAYHDLLGWLRAHGLPSAPRGLRVLDRGTHGWVEWVEPADLPSMEAVRAYFRSAGTLICLAHVLSATDLHSENLIASADGPVLVDTEMLLQPSLRALDADGDDHIDVKSHGSCLATGLVSFVVIDAGGRAFDVGGLRPAQPRRLSVPMRRWTNLRRADIDHTPQYEIRPELHNDVRCNGRVQRLEDFDADVCAGFEDAYRVLTSTRAALLADDSPLRGFAACRTRVLFRPSDRYAAAQYALAAPRYQRRGIDRSLGLETFDRVFVRDVERPRLWPLIADERRMLEALEIPRLTLPVSSTDLQSSSGETVRGYYAHSGLDVVRDRLAALTVTDHGYQVEQVRAACARPAQPIVVDRAAGAARRDDDLVAAAEMIGASLLKRAHRNADGSLCWASSRGRLDLYSGAIGIAVFLAALARATSRGMWRTAAERTLRCIDAEIGAARTPEFRRLGICSGRGSIAYGLTLVGSLLGDGAITARAAAVLSGIDARAIEADRLLDVEGGAAGTLLACLAVYGVSRDDRLIAIARACVARLEVGQSTAGADRGAWPTGADARARPGFAHGVSGIAYALSRWSAVAPSESIHAHIHDAWHYERRFFAENGSSWPAVRPDGGRVPMTAWCHGAPGIALGRSAPPAALDDRDLAVEIERAMSQTLSAPPTPLDHLCCGNLGRADVALTVGLRRQSRAWVDAGVAGAQLVAARVLADGRFGVRGRGFQAGAPAPELFQGLAGIGYQLLRASSPVVFPSVLAFESPGAAS